MGDKNESWNFLKNAKEYRLEKLKQVQIVDPETTPTNYGRNAKLLRIPVEQRHIEGFDSIFKREQSLFQHVVLKMENQVNLIIEFLPCKTVE